MRIEIHDLESLAAHLRQHRGLDGVVCQSLDLASVAEQLRAVSAAGALFLGCHVDDQTKLHLVETGGLLFPRLPDLPYDPYRSQLYSLDELMAGYRPGVAGSFLSDTRDSAIYRHFSHYREIKPSSILETLAQRLHDHSIDNALEDLLREHSDVAAIMGGHSLTRDQPSYRAVAEIGRGLTRAGFLVVTGGGPGAMEAGNLGAWLAGYPDEALDRALDLLGVELSFRTAEYLEAGFRVVEEFPRGSSSLAVPTWFYGHEPTNQFSTHIAKYFANSLREDGLLAIANRGVVYAPGSAGTVQEIFMDATQNHYGTFRWVSPMVLFDRQYWTATLPAYGLLRTLAGERQYGHSITVSDSPGEVVDYLLEHPPVEFQRKPAQH